MRTKRHQREIDYHASHAARFAPAVPSFNILESNEPRPWNAYWEAIWRLRDHDTYGKRALVVGCGTGQDAIILAKMGATVDAFDLSPDMLAIARESARLSGVDVRFEEAPAEAIPFTESTFDIVFVRDILHHVDISATVREIRRTCKHGALLVLSEIYCHSVLRWVRKNLIGWAVPAAHLLSQGGQYETEDEEPLNERDVRQIRSIIDVESESYFCVLAGRIAPQTRRWAVIDRSLASAFTGGRLLIIGRVL